MSTTALTDVGLDFSIWLDFDWTACYPMLIAKPSSFSEPVRKTGSTN